MLKIAQIHWTAKQLSKMANSEQITFDNPMQRGLVWDPIRKSKLINSMLEGYPIPAIYTEKSNGLYDVLDGKQRCSTIIDFLNDKFILREESPIELSDGTFTNITRLKFSELNEELQDRIKDYNLSVYYVEDASYEQKKEMFVRLNSGKAMTNVELTKAQTRSASEIVEIANHPVFDLIMDDKSKNRSTNVGFAMQAYSILFNESKCLLNVKIKATLKNKKISKEETKLLISILDIYKDCFEILDKNRSENANVLTKIKRKSHFISLIPVAEYAHSKSIGADKFAEWLKIFFNSEEGTTINQDYNSTLEGGMNREDKVRTRIDTALSSFKAYMDGDFDNITGNSQLTM